MRKQSAAVKRPESAEVVYERQSMGCVVNEIQPLLEAHWQEIAHYKDILLSPYRNRYRLAEANKSLALYSMRERSENTSRLESLIVPTLSSSRDRRRVRFKR
jgi:hypothetical protein